MAGLDFKALNEVQEELVNRSGGDGLFFYQKEIGKETDIRILPPYPNMHGKYFLEVVCHWINGKKYISPETFGRPCVMQQMIDEAKASGDKELKALLDDKDNFQKKYEYIMPILLLDLKFEGQEVVDVKVKDGRAKILSCGPMLMKRINKVVCGRQYMNGTPEGITNREKGNNIILSKVGEKLNTDYDATGDVSWEMDEKYYKDYPNVVDLTEKAIYPDDYLEGVMKNYLYGDPMPPEPKMPERESTTSKKAETSTGRGAAKVTSTRGAKTDDKPAARTRGKAVDKTEEGTKERETPKETGSRRNLLKDLENLD